MTLLDHQPGCYRSQPGGTCSEGTAGRGTAKAGPRRETQKRAGEPVQGNVSGMTSLPGRAAA